MGRAPCCDKANVKKGPWSPEEDSKLKEFIEKNGTGGNWIALPHKAGLRRCGKSCRLRWLNYLRPNIKHGEFSADEDRIICGLFASIGSRWSIIASQLPGRTDNDIKNYWNTKLKKKLLGITAPQRKPHQHQQHQQQQHHHHHYQQQFLQPSFGITTIAPSSSSSHLLTSLEAPTYLQGSSTQQYHLQNNGSLLNFGGEPSCSSSDGSCTQITYANDADYDYGTNGGDQLSFENYLYGGGIQENQKLTLAAAGTGDGEAPLEYDYDEIKQLLAANSGCNSSTFVQDHSSATTTTTTATRGGSFIAQERVMYYH